MHSPSDLVAVHVLSGREGVGPDTRNYRGKDLSISSRFFENQPNEICSHMLEKASKGRFLGPDKLQNRSNEGKLKERRKRENEEEERRRRDKSNGCTLSFYNGYFGRKLLNGKGPFGSNFIYSEL